MKDDWLDKIKWGEDGLVPAVTQEAGSGRVLTVAWMNRDALGKTAQTGEAHYWSRSRRKLWRNQLKRGAEMGYYRQYVGEVMEVVPGDDRTVVTRVKSLETSASRRSSPARSCGPTPSASRGRGASHPRARNPAR